MIDPDVKLGRNVRIFAPDLVNLFGCEIGDDTFIGPFVEITRGVIVGKRCKIESHAFICDSVVIEDEVFIGHGTVFTNDLYPKVGRNVTYAKTLVKKGSSIGSNATIVGGVTIGCHAVIGAGAVVCKDIPSLAIAIGNPAIVSRQFESLGELLGYMTSRQPLKSGE